jgi:uncharacterized protein
MDFSIHQQVLLLAFVVAIFLGAAMHKSNFCTMGAISDWVNIGHKGRLGAWFLAIAVAILGVIALEALNVVSIQNKALGVSFPPYRTAQFAWLSYLLGGMIFGIGMTLAGGCGSRTLIRVGGGSLKALVVVAVVAVVAYFMVYTDFYKEYFLVWIGPTRVNLARWGIANQEIGTILSGAAGFQDSLALHVIMGVLIASAFLLTALRLRAFRENGNNVFGGAAVGLAVIAGWAITGGPLGEAWGEALFLNPPPPGQEPIRVATQSFTFVAPMADVANFLVHGARPWLVSFGLVAFVGVVTGSLLYAVIAGRFRLEWFASAGDFFNHVLGGVLMGVGGVLAMGCSIGQGITGVSTLAVGSFLALFSMIFGSALTMKVQYYLLDKKGFLCALRYAAADLKLLPKPGAP